MSPGRAGLCYLAIAGAIQMLASGLATSITGALVGGSPLGLAV